jgi:TonB family protein
VGALPDVKAGSVHFALFDTLTPEHGRARLRELAPGAFFAALHLAAVLSLRLATGNAPLVQELLGEPVTYLDVPPPPQAESPRTVVKPRPIVVSEAVKIPVAEAAVTRPDRMAGFQELLAPREIKELPMPDAAVSAVNEVDFSGRGVVGGVAGGKPPQAVSAAVAESLNAEGPSTDVHAPVAPRRELRAVALEEVEVKPRLLNEREILQRLLDVYPPGLRSMGIEGTAIVQFVVDTNGRVEPGSIRVVSSTHPLFESGALQVVPWGKFSPGRMNVQGGLVPVRVSARVPLKWSMQKQ